MRNIVGFEELKFMILKIKKCFLENKVLYTSHAKTELQFINQILKCGSITGEERNEMCYMRQPGY